jgi:hypothetical protein
MAHSICCAPSMRKPRRPGVATECAHGQSGMRLSHLSENTNGLRMSGRTYQIQAGDRAQPCQVVMEPAEFGICLSQARFAMARPVFVAFALILSTSGWPLNGGAPAPSNSVGVQFGQRKSSDRGLAAEKFFSARQSRLGEQTPGQDRRRPWLSTLIPHWDSSGLDGWVSASLRTC